MVENFMELLTEVVFFDFPPFSRKLKGATAANPVQSNPNKNFRNKQ